MKKNGKNPIVNPASVANLDQIHRLQSECYAERIGKRYGDLEVVGVEYDWETRKQLWHMKCVLCGQERKTYNGNEYVKGKNSGICKCRAQKAKAEKIAAQQKRLSVLADELLRLKGQVFRIWEVVECKSENTWRVRCVLCGRETNHSAKRIREKSIKCLCECGYDKYDIEKWRGKRHGYLRVIDKAGARFVCECDCGNQIVVRAIDFALGSYSTCGCELRNKLYSESSTTHGDTKSDSPHARIYRIYQGMKARCYIESTDSYPDYGGRGISICEEWRNSYEAFKVWALDNGYRDDLSIDRIDNDGNYEPSNCRWATAKVQRANQRPHKPHRCKHVWTIDGETKPAKDWCAEYDLSVPMVMYRVKNRGMTPYEALTTPKEQGRPKKNT